MDKKYYTTWDDIHNTLKRFIIEFSRNHDVDFLANTDIVTIARGGLIPAQIVAYQLGISKIHTIGLTSYINDKEGLKFKTPNIYQTLSKVYSKNILIIDDISDMGSTLGYAVECIKEYKSVQNIISFTLFSKVITNYKPDYFGKEVETGIWVVFPWDKDSGYINKQER